MVSRPKDSQGVPAKKLSGDNEISRHDKPDSFVPKLEVSNYIILPNTEKGNDIEKHPKNLSKDKMTI